MNDSTMKTRVLLPCILSVLLSVSNLNAVTNNAPKTLKKAEKKVEKTADKVKQKVEDVTDSINKENIDKTVDQIANYFDPEKIKDMVDQLAQQLDKEQIKQMVDMVAQYINAENIKEWIDIIGEHVDKDSIKQKLYGLVDSIDKEKIKDKINQGVDKVADSLDNTIHLIENELKNTALNAKSFQEYVRSYDWKYRISDKFTSDVITLTNFKFDGQQKVAIVKPGERVHGAVRCSIDQDHLSSFSKYNVVLGIKNQPGQQAVYSHFGLKADNEQSTFELTAPSKPGIYRIGFRVVKTPIESRALKNWEEDSSESPTIGLLIVR